MPSRVSLSAVGEGTAEGDSSRLRMTEGERLCGRRAARQSYSLTEDKDSVAYSARRELLSALFAVS